MTSRRAYVPWTKEESDALEAGLALYGDGAWGAIASDPHFAPALRRREPTQLKDRARTLKKQAAAQSKVSAPPAAAKPAVAPAAPKPAKPAVAPPPAPAAPKPPAADDGRFDDDDGGFDDVFETAFAAPKAPLSKPPTAPAVLPPAPALPTAKNDPLLRQPQVAHLKPPKVVTLPPPRFDGTSELPILAALRRGFEEAVAAHTAPLAALHASLGAQLGGLQQGMTDSVEAHLAAVAAARAEAAKAIQGDPRSPAPAPAPEPDWRIVDDLEDEGAIIQALHEMSPRDAAVALAVGRSLANAAERKRARAGQGLPAAQHRRSV